MDFEARSDEADLRQLKTFPGILRNANCGDLTLRTKLAVLLEERRRDATRDLRRSALLTLPGGGRCISIP